MDKTNASIDEKTLSTAKSCGKWAYANGNPGDPDQDVALADLFPAEKSEQLIEQIQDAWREGWCEECAVDYVATEKKISKRKAAEMISILEAETKIEKRIQAKKP